MRNKLIKLARDSGLFEKAADWYDPAFSAPSKPAPSQAVLSAQQNFAQDGTPMQKKINAGATSQPAFSGPSMGVMPTNQRFSTPLPAPAQAPSFGKDMGKVLGGITPAPFQRATSALTQVANKGFDKLEDAVVSTQGPASLNRYRQTRDATRTNGVGHPGDMARQVVTQAPFLSSTAAAGFLRKNPISAVVEHPAASVYSVPQNN